MGKMGRETTRGVDTASQRRGERGDPQERCSPVVPRTRSREQPLTWGDRQRSHSHPFCVWVVGDAPKMVSTPALEAGFWENTPRNPVQNEKEGMENCDSKDAFMARRRRLSLSTAEWGDFWQRGVILHTHAPHENMKNFVR